MELLKETINPEIETEKFKTLFPAVFSENGFPETGEVIQCRNNIVFTGQNFIMEYYKKNINCYCSEVYVVGNQIERNLDNYKEKPFVEIARELLTKNPQINFNKKEFEEFLFGETGRIYEERNFHGEIELYVETNVRSPFLNH